ncbi:NUDIX domain-containing protein [Mycolicibacterium sp. 018/SC-01/001]|uniref:NUDIX domain-containing protein n=1 Tax=Mycolicibacterium sp. 018/SC-01/001 TaxID=2592069 RepID=UPI001180DD3C|nr:NUDIX domain-containing protein [Mycolicibacterium sp. 018/SC-01/001]TRW82333.1 NUDIX domain-containing protein [Mycolicibacterium sp. 018/SC-01/001]
MTSRVPSRRAQRSAGLLLYRNGANGLEVLLGHPGGPFWARKDDGAWSIPKGEYDDGEDPWAAAQREFAEEVGTPPPAGPRIDLPPVRQSGGKIVTAFAVRGDLDPSGAVSNTFTMEWPPRSGKTAEFPELDRIAWWDLPTAREKLLTSQRPLLDALIEALG